MSYVQSVGELTRNIKRLIENNFFKVEVTGEISNFKAHESGHWYFTLKDSEAQLSCAMWQSYNRNVKFKPQDGLKVIAIGKITVFPPKGNYQLEVSNLIIAGYGELYLLFEQLKKKLEAEGLFDPARKRPIPQFPKKIGIATAIGGAAYKDMKSVAMRRYPLVEIIIVDCRVQGEGAAQSIVEAINTLNKIKDLDVIIVGRGGGSIEDLWAFNEEIVARAIYNSKIPVISAVGHEIDYTIADFVADKRAATPTAAMELATPDINELFEQIKKFNYNINLNINNFLKKKKSRLDFFSKSYIMNKPIDLLFTRMQTMDFYFSKINDSITTAIKDKKSKLDIITKTIEKYDIQHPLSRGFALVYQDNKLIKKSVHLNKLAEFYIKFSDGEVKIN